MKDYSHKAASVVFVFLLFLAGFNTGHAVSVDLTKASGSGLLDRVDSIDTHRSDAGTAVTVIGNGRISDYMTQTFDSPPKVVVDIFCTPQKLGTTQTVPENPTLNGIRIGYHPRKIRVVLDVKGPEVPDFVTTSKDRELTVFLKAANSKERQSPQAGNTLPGGSGRDEWTQRNLKGDGAGRQRSLPGIEDAVPAAIDSVPPIQPILLEAVLQTHNAGPPDLLQRAETPANIDREKMIPEDLLAQSVPDDGREVTAAFIKALEAYKAQNWTVADKALTEFIKTYPQSGFSERAHFLAAIAFEKTHADSKASHFKEIKRRYENAINKFQNSRFVSDAFWRIGNLCYKTGSYYEALGYFNLIIKKEQDTIAAARSLVLKSRIYLLLKKREDALNVSAVLEKVVAGFPGQPENIEAKVLRAKILYEFNEFRKSLDILLNLKASVPESLRRHPEISLYLGYDYYQIGDNARARENLFRFFNTCPGQDANHMVLTQIGDTYRNERLPQKAARIYQMVIERYPESEGAVISKIRLAEQQEESNIKPEDRVLPAVDVIGAEVAMAKELYEEIINNPLNRDKHQTLTKLALLKLAVLYQKQEEYRKSFVCLKTLHEEYSLDSLKSDWEKATANAIGGIFEQAVQKKNFVEVVNFYFKEKELVDIVNAPGLFVTTARAFLKLDFEDMATEMFLKAESLLSDAEKPADLLYWTASDFLKKERFEASLRHLDLLIERHPADERVPDAYRLKGGILLKQKKYTPAAEMFTKALNYSVDTCDRLKLLIEKGRALTSAKQTKNASETIAQANEIKNRCERADFAVYREIGDLYFELDEIQSALNFYQRGAEMAMEKPDKLSLTLKVAQCYTLLNQKDAFFALYNRISGLNDPFWSGLARERMNEIRFDWEMRQKSKEWKIGENI